MEELINHPEQIQYWQQLHREGTTNFNLLFKGYDAIVDFPGYIFYQAIYLAYPEAKVILSTRDFDSWYKSAANTIYQSGPNLTQKVLLSFQLPFSSRLRKLIKVVKFANKVVWQEEFAGKFEDKAFAKSVFEQHHEAVKRSISPEKLLVYHVKDGWEPLCQFLDKPVPTETFPRVNQQVAFKENQKKLLKNR